MNKFWFDLLKSTSVENINFLKDVNKAIRFDMNAKWKFQYIQHSNGYFFKEFILNLEPNSLFTVIPMISIDGVEHKPHLILSQQFLITKYSDPELIIKFLIDQMHIAYNDFEFDLNLGDKFNFLILKYKKIELI